MDSLLCKERCLRGFYCFGKWSSVWRGLADWFGVQLSWQSFVDLACTLKILLYTQVPYPYHLLHSWLRHGGCDIIVNSQYLNGVAPRPRRIMRYVGDMFFCWYVFVMSIYYIYAFLRIIKKGKKRFKKKYIDAMDWRRVRVLPWMRVWFRV